MTRASGEPPPLTCAVKAFPVVENLHKRGWRVVGLPLTAMVRPFGQDGFRIRDLDGRDDIEGLYRRASCSKGRWLRMAP